MAAGGADGDSGTIKLLQCSLSTKVSRRWRRSGVHRLLHAIEQTQRQGQKEVKLGVEVVHVDDLPVEVRLGDRPLQQLPVQLAHRVVRRQAVVHRR